jgi:hypothetical protein
MRLEKAYRKASKAQNDLGYHLYWTYASLWTALLVFFGVLNFFAGAFMFFHATEVLDVDGVMKKSFALNDFQYAIPTGYFVILWALMFVLLVVVGWWGLCEIEDSTMHHRDEDD